MSKIAFDLGDDQIAANYAEVVHREAYVSFLLESLERAPRADVASCGSYDEWYLATLREGLFRRALVIEARGWARQLEDLLRDQLTRNGIDSAYWDEVKEAEAGEGFVASVRAVLSRHLGVDLPQDIWARLEEMTAVADTIVEGTLDARRRLAETYPDYFNEMDVFGDGDAEGAGRLTLTADHLTRAFAAAKAFWDPHRGIPYRLVEGAA